MYVIVQIYIRAYLTHKKKKCMLSESHSLDGLLLQFKNSILSGRSIKNVLNRYQHYTVDSS